MRNLVSFVQFKKRKNTHWGVLLLVKLQALSYNVTKSSTPWMFFTYFKMCTWHWIAQSITYVLKSTNQPFSKLNLPFSRSPNTRKIRIKVGQKEIFFLLYELLHQQNSSFKLFFALIYSQQRGKQNRDRDFLVFKYFLNNLFLTFFIYFQNSLIYYNEKYMTHY